MSELSPGESSPIEEQELKSRMEERERARREKSEEVGEEDLKQRLRNRQMSKRIL
jgi:hypothetical protein